MRFGMVSLLLLLLVMFGSGSGEKKEPTKDEPFNFDVENKKIEPLPSCHWNYKYDIARSVIAGLCFFMGGFILLFGYKRRRISFCFIGLTSTSIFTYMIIITEGNFSLLINILISLAVGLFISLFTTTLLYCGCFITGLFAGFTVGFAFLLVYSAFSTISSIGLACVIVAIAGLVQVFITMWWRHRIFILSACIFGAAIMAASIDYFVEGLFIFKYTEMKVFYNRTAELCWWSYVILGLWPLLTILGLLVQCLWTGKERQKQEYTFLYRRQQIIREIHDDCNRLL